MYLVKVSSSDSEYNCSNSCIFWKSHSILTKIKERSVVIAVQNLNLHGQKSFFWRLTIISGRDIQFVMILNTVGYILACIIAFHIDTLISNIY